jgi:hypothetical protein
MVVEEQADFRFLLIDSCPTSRLRANSFLTYRAKNTEKPRIWQCKMRSQSDAGSRIDMTVTHLIDSE